MSAASRPSPQQNAIADLRSVLQSVGETPPDDETLATLLEVEGWNVTRAAKLIQDDSTAERRRSGADDETIARSFAQQSQVDSMGFDDSASTPLMHPSTAGSGAPSRSPGGAGLYHNHRQPPGGGSNLAQIIWTTLTFPFSLASSLLLFLARILRLRYVLPGLFGGTSDSRAGRMGYTDPRICAERLIRELEEETGGTTSAEPTASSSDMDANAGARAPVRPRLPPFYVGGYNDALRAAKEQIKILAVILVSREHGDVETFKKTTLVDPALVEMLSKGDFIVWGGDVKEREAYQVASTLQASTYPFVAFIALQPPRTRARGMNTSYASSSASPRPAVLSRLEGSPLSATSASTIASHISDLLLPRTRPFLDRLRGERRRRELERELKAEQDRAYLEASRRDAERVMQKREEEKKKVAEAERQRREAEQRELLQRKKQSWQRWARANLVPAEPCASDASVRLSFRLPSGKTLVRRFKTDDRMESVFAFVETASIAEDAQTAVSSTEAKPDGYDHIFQFTLVTGYPRKRIEPTDVMSKVIKDIDGLSPSANLIVEGAVLGDGLREEDDDDDDSDSSDV